MQKNIYDIVNEHENWRLYNCINLIPSENVTSPQVRAILSCDMGHRYTLPFTGKLHGSIVENAYRGTRYMDEVEQECMKLACKVYKSKFACVRPLSGHISAMISMLTVMKRNQKYLAIDEENGGYDGYGKDYFGDIFGLKSQTLPFNTKKWRIETKKATQLVKKYRPRAVVLGASFILFPYDLGLMKNACNSSKSYLLYDASHVLGLIAGGYFQPEPLQNGVDLLFGSTHKSFFGPQGGIILTNRKDIFEGIEKNITWRTMDNAHWNRIAALAQSFTEIERFGPEYARQTIENAKNLGKALVDRGFPIKYSNLDFTESHQLAIDGNKIYSKYNLELNDMAKLLERNNIITDAVGRLGTNEITRLGMKKAEMNRLSEIIVIAVKERKDVTENVRLLRKDFEIEYCFK